MMLQESNYFCYENKICRFYTNLRINLSLIAMSQLLMTLLFSFFDIYVYVIEIECDTTRSRVLYNCSFYHTKG